jgi:hypothetical protein
MRETKHQQSFENHLLENFRQKTESKESRNFNEALKISNKKTKNEGKPKFQQSFESLQPENEKQTKQKKKT